MTKIQVTVGEDGHMIIEATGHTQSVVCASVSTLLQSSVRFLQELSDQYPNDLEVKIKTESKEKREALLILRGGGFRETEFLKLDEETVDVEIARFHKEGIVKIYDFETDSYKTVTPVKVHKALLVSA